MLKYPLFLKLSLTIFLLGILPAIIFIVFFSFAYEDILQKLLEAFQSGKGLSTSDIESLIANIRLGTTVFLFILTMALLGGVYSITRALTRTINHIIEAIRRIRKDDYDFEISPAGNDEFAFLANELNQLLVKLREVRKREIIISEEKSQLISITAHQLRTPLVAIKWSLSMAADPKVPSVEREQLFNQSISHTNRMAKLITDILDVAKIEEGRFGSNYIQTNITPILKNLIQLYDLEAKRRHIRLEFIVVNALPNILCDPERLRIAFENIIKNAVVFSKENGLITILGERAPEGLRVIVKDQGIGISPAERARISQKFFRGVHAIKVYPEGSGLGLFTAKNIIKAHRGTINIESKENEGTTVTITLPLSMPKEEKPPFQEFIGE